MIPITFNKNDANNLKKGNIRGQDLASYLSISMPKVAGILDIFTNPVSITNNVISSGYTTLTLNKGYVNIYGRCIYIEQGEQVQVRLPTSGTTNGIFGIRVNLGQTGSNEVEWFTSTTNLQQDNLLNNEIDGIYEFGIYRYTATTNSFILGEKIAPIIQNINDYMQGSNFITQPLNDSSDKIATTQFVKNYGNQYLNQSTASDIIHYISNNAVQDIGYVSGWTNIENRMYFKHKFELGSMIIYTGRINNPSGKGQEYWYKLELPANLANAHKVVMAMPDYSASGRDSNAHSFSTWQDGRNVYISRDRVAIQNQDRLNASYLLIIFK